MTESQDLSVRCVGDGIPVLIIHGWTMAGFVEANDFEPIFIRNSGYLRIYVDLPGMGDSPIGAVVSLNDMLERVLHIVEKHILPSKFLLIGSSLGAYLARAVAYKYGNSVDGLLLRVPVVEPDSPKRDTDPFVPLVADEVLLSSLSDADRQTLGEIAVQTPGYIDALRQRIEAVVLPAIATSDPASLDLIRNDPNRYRLSAPLHTAETPFSKPTLIVTGRQDTDVGYRDSWPLTRCYPRATFVALDRADHGLPVDDADVNLFKELVENWLRRVEELRQPEGR